MSADEFRMARQRIGEAVELLERLRGRERMLAEPALSALAEARLNLETAIASPLGAWRGADANPAPHGSTPDDATAGFRDEP